MYNEGKSFRCDLQSDDGLYAAVWTPYDPSLASQPKPDNCGQKIKFKNPRSGVAAEATIIDRCASCVGVGRQTSDPTAPDVYVNGATVDLSEDLWNLLYGGAPGSVYDIEYDGPRWLGSTKEPVELRDPTCA